jgi:hypothetical protein
VEEEWTTFWSTYGGQICLVGGCFAVGFKSLVTDKLIKTERKKKQNFQDRPSD